MATTPRAGIINLNFKDVSEMAQNIADNDPWKLGIETAGKVLTDREKYILYQRALADAQGKDRPEDKTAGELIGSGIDKAGDAFSWLGEKAGDGIDKAGDAFSWLGEKAGKGIDKLRALLPSDTIEKSYEEGEMTEDGINVTFPTTVVGKDKEIERPRREVGGKFDWTFPDKGYNTEFPTTVVGAPEDTKETVTETAPVADAETAPIAGAETAPESASPFGDTEAKPQKIKAPRMTEMEAWSEMNRLNPQRATFDYNRVKDAQTKAIDQKNKTQGLLKEVAADFANYSPDDQATWTEARNRWLDIDPNLAQFIPAEATQNAWDRVQNQGGMGKNVAPKGDFAQRKYLEDQVKQSTFLSNAARASGKFDEANFYADKALKIQNQLDGRTSNGITVESVIEKYNKAILALENATSKDFKADTTDLFAKISADIGSGDVLTEVERRIDARLEEKRGGKKTATEYSDDELKTQADTYKELAKVLSENKAKVRSAISLIKKKIPSGGARIAAKTLQGDVLAESEFSSYKNANPLNQALSNWANKFAGVSFISEQDAQNLVDALIETYNTSAEDYIKALSNNKYKDKI